MDRTAVKKFAIEARRILLQQVAAQTERLGITIDRITEPQTVSGGLIVAGITLDTIESHQYQQLRRRLQDLHSQEKTLKGAVTALIDEVAYTWFNRLAALRFMEVNGYLKRRVLSSSDPKLVDPDLLRDASTLRRKSSYYFEMTGRLGDWETGRNKWYLDFRRSVLVISRN